MPARISRHPKRWGRIRRRHLWPVLGSDELTELRILTPTIRKMFLEQIECGAIRSARVAAESLSLRIESLCVGDYLKICRACYASAYQVDVNQNAEELYRAFADGRNGGLLSLPRSSHSALAKWLSTGAFAGCHPFEIVRNQIVLSIHMAQSGGHWMRLACRRRDFVNPHIILMALGLARAGVGFGMENIADYVLFAQGADWVGVADDGIWERGCPDWPPNSGILNGPQNSFLVSELAEFPAVLRKVRWFKASVRIRRLS
jgi:hypothetical protein